MDLSTYVEALRSDVTAAAAIGGPDVARAAELVADAIDPALRLVLLDLLTDVANDLTAALDGPSVEVRLRGREPELVVTGPMPEPAPAPAPPKVTPAPPPAAKPTPAPAPAAKVAPAPPTTPSAPAAATAPAEAAPAAEEEMDPDLAALLKQLE